MLPSLCPRSSHLPEGGLAAASTEVRDLSIVVMPALAIEMVCCSMACQVGVAEEHAFSYRSEKQREAAPHSCTS